MNRIQKVMSSAILASLLAVAPLAASASTVGVQGSTGVVISPSGIVRVIGADVTSVGNGFVNAVTTLGNVTINWLVNASTSTKIVANGSSSASTTGINVGDKIDFAGTLSSTSSILTVAATKIRDITTSPFRIDTKGHASSTPETKGKHDFLSLHFFGGFHFGNGK